MILDTYALKRYALLKFLSGMTSPAEIAKAAGLDGEAETAVRHYFGTMDFAIELKRAQKDQAASVVDAIKEQLFKFLEEYTNLALTCGDPRVRAQILKDLLDRGGTGATQKMALTSPDAYRKKVEEYLEPDEKVGGSDPDGDAPDLANGK